MWRRFVVNREEVELPAKSFTDMPSRKYVHVADIRVSAAKINSPPWNSPSLLAPMGEISGGVPKTFKNDDPERGP